MIVETRLFISILSTSWLPSRIISKSGPYRCDNSWFGFSTALQCSIKTLHILGFCQTSVFKHAMFENFSLGVLGYIATLGNLIGRSKSCEGKPRLHSECTNQTSMHTEPGSYWCDVYSLYDWIKFRSILIPCSFTQRKACKAKVKKNRTQWIFFSIRAILSIVSIVKQRLKMLNHSDWVEGKCWHFYFLAATVQSVRAKVRINVSKYIMFSHSP